MPYLRDMLSVGSNAMVTARDVPQNMVTFCRAYRLLACLLWACADRHDASSLS